MPQREIGHICQIIAFKTTKNVSRNSRDTKVDPHQVQDPTWTFNRPYRAPKMDLKIFEPLSGCICYFYIIHYTLYILAPLTMLEHFCGHCGTLPRLRGPSWTFMDPKRDPIMDPARLIPGDPLQKRARQGPFMVRIGQFFLQTFGQRTNLNLQPGLRSIRHLVPQL